MNIRISGFEYCEKLSFQILFGRKDASGGVTSLSIRMMQPLCARRYCGSTIYIVAHIPVSDTNGIGN